MNIEINMLADSNNFNLLLLTAKYGKSDAIKILLNIGMSTNMPNNNINAQNLAWENHHYDVVFELIQANLVYPDSFEISQCQGKLRKFYEIIESLHEAIRTNDLSKAKEILDQYPNLHYFYNSSNDSALKIAILSNSIEMYEFLLSRKIMFGPHEDSEELFQKLSDTSKRAVREIHNKYTQHSPEKHLNILLANSFICHDDPNAKEKMDIVQNAYRKLNSNVLVRIVLMIVAASKNFKIIFDFNRESVSAADPTVDSYTQGLFYPTGRIYIGAKQLLNETTEHETLSNMAHELCHFAVNLTYCNSAKPYCKNDNQTIQEFEKILEECLLKSGKEDIIDMVNECYPTDMHHAELIVRVVHMIVFYQDHSEKLDLIRVDFKSLFEFYEAKVVPEMEKALIEIENRNAKEIQQKDRKIYKFKLISILAIIFAIICIIAGITISTTLYNKAQKLEENKNLTRHNHIECLYKLHDFIGLGELYYCKAATNLNVISPETAIINSLSGSHWLYKDDDDIYGVIANDKNIKYFPKGLELIFKNLILIDMENGKIKELHQSDLMPLEDLVYLDLGKNDIEILEDGIFDYNPNLAIVSFFENKIHYIESIQMKMR